MPADMNEQFLGELDRAVQSRLARIGEINEAEPDASAAPIAIADLLATALKKELEAAEEAAMWLVTEKDLEVKLALMRQCGDEAKHYRLIEKRLRELGVDTAAIDPRSGGYSPMFAYLKTLDSTVERVAAGQFTREALAKVLNETFIELCVERGDEVTAALYRDVIQPDEGHHHELGRKLLARLAVTDDDRRKARTAALRTLEIAEEVQDLVRVKKGITRAPGC
jgi:uncharacterized ferritin-like protein (DUF455 family)